MDRDEALRLLRGGPEGVAKWNRRRAADEEIPDLTEADLHGAHLHGADLGGADLSRADLRGADLGGAFLRGAKLTGAKLTGADLRGANLGGADLTWADLTGANLTRADLTLARLIRYRLDNALFDDAIVTDCHVQETIGRPRPPVQLRIKDRPPLTGEDARNFFNPPAIVEVYLTGRLTELELGCYHFHLGDMYYQQVGIGVHFVGFRHEGDGSVLRFQGETFDDVYRVLPHLLAPFRFSEAIDWEETFAAMPDNRRTEATIRMIQLAAKTPKARYRLAEQMGLHLKSFGAARMEWIRTKSGSGEAVQILVACNQKTIKQIEEERRAEIEYQRNSLQLEISQSRVLMVGRDYMPGDFNARDIVGSIVGDDNTLQARDINHQQLWNQAGSSIDLPALAEELGRLRATMRQEASEPEHDEALGAVASAEKAAKQGDGPRALEYLKAAGKWTLGIAEKIGTELAVAAMKKMMGEG